MSQRRFLYVVTQAPYSNVSGQEALDAALIGASFDIEVAILFIHDGVHQIRRNQAAASVGMKPVTKAFAALADFDISRVYAHSTSLTARGLSKQNLMIEVQLADDQYVRALIEQHDKVITF
ncbi:sulfurtransferase complex subunit TusC [Arenicella xantha]|uniref:tRNA 2-thiouridine synthesizing protein C n=1 Tax=Arenicella xantha TaxID=644221 RepID=A0A395JN01_9GAMM|nr:sulfurtransferase complex subunit TusC [Arenicella xantha]RBP52673.1 tRNA 2-thiouridine synthesizing protein C [Arenicella xantha]